MDVAEPWLDRLLQEFFKQSDAEKLEGLPVTPFMDREKITKPSSQCSFIGFVLLPLFEALGDLFPELQVRYRGSCKKTVRGCFYSWLFLRYLSTVTQIVYMIFLITYKLIIPWWNMDHQFLQVKIERFSWNYLSTILFVFTYIKLFNWNFTERSFCRFIFP